MKQWKYILVTFFVALILGCSSFKGYVESFVEIGKERGMSEEYLASLQTWTKEQTAYSQFETKFYISTTYKSEAFNKAYLKEQARFLNLSEQEQSRREELQRQMDAGFTEFFFYAYTADRNANNFADRNSMWRVFLMDAQGRQIDPVEIRRVDRDKVTPIIESFFPYVRKYYGYCYHLKFPRQTSESVQLVFTSYLGKIELDW